MRTCVLIPTYNEAKRIGSLISKIKRQLLDVVVVDDGSEDETPHIAEDSGAHLIRHRVNLGKGVSLRDGFEYCLEKGYDLVITMDGDGQHNPAEIPRFLNELRSTNAGMIIGNRMGQPKNMPLVRRWTNRFMSFFLSIIVGQKIPDSQCGFRLVRRDVLEKVKLLTSKFEIESELLIVAKKSGFKIHSVPISVIYRGEASKIRPITDAIRFLKFILKTLTRR